MQRAESNSSCCTESTSSSSTTNRGELEGRLVAAGSFRCGEAVHCQDGKLAGDLLRLWPDGKIGRPEEYGEVAWERVMGVNEKWSYPAESNGSLHLIPTRAHWHAPASGSISHLHLRRFSPSRYLLPPSLAFLIETKSVPCYA